MTERLQSVITQIQKLPEETQDTLAAQLEASLQELLEAEQIAAQLADPQETDLDYLLQRADDQSRAGQVYDLDEIL